LTVVSFEPVVAMLLHVSCRSSEQRYTHVSSLSSLQPLWLWLSHCVHVVVATVPAVQGYGQNGDRSKWRQVKTATNQNGYRSKV